MPGELRTRVVFYRNAKFKDLTASQRVFVNGLGTIRVPRRQRTLPRTPNRTLGMECGHTVEFVLPRPKIGDKIYCRTCQDYQKVSK